jgi:hypothetical protein
MPKSYLSQNQVQRVFIFLFLEDFAKQKDNKSLKLHVNRGRNIAYQPKEFYPIFDARTQSNQTQNIEDLSNVKVNSMNKKLQTPSNNLNILAKHLSVKSDFNVVF